MLFTAGLRALHAGLTAGADSQGFARFAQKQRGDLLHHGVLDIVLCDYLGTDCTDMFLRR